MRIIKWNESVIEVARCFVDNQSTIREVAKRLQMSKSGVHLKLRELLEYPEIYYKEQELAIRVSELIAKNKQERHSRGGNRTKQIKAELKRKKEKC